MASAVEKRYFTFVKGLNTEAGPLTYPENSWVDGDNFIPKVDGSLNKRRGIDVESGHSLSAGVASISLNTTQEKYNALSVGEWTNVAGDGNTNFTVVQLGAQLLFYNNVTTGQSGSYVGSITLTNASGNPNAAGTSPVSLYSAQGKLIVVSADTEPRLLSYSNGVISSATLSIQIRDVNGLDDGLAVDNKPNTLSLLHQYNLYNQGWPQNHINTYYASGSTYPSNAQVWHAGKDGSGNFSVSALNNIEFGSTPAARGRYILNLFDRNRDSVSGLTGLSRELETYRPSTVSFWAGRAWYSGVRSSTIGQWVLYSQVATADSNYGKCYQSADPTAEEVSDLIASDGGVIPIQEAGDIVRLLPFNNSMLVFADNGVWQIRTGIDDVFSATSYSVVRLTNVGCIAPRSVLEIDQSVFYWGVNGIYVVRRTESGSYVVDNITRLTVQSFYTSIDSSNKAYAQGVHYEKDEVVYWLYRAASRTGNEYRYKFDSVLALDLRLQSFYTMSIGSLSSHSPYVFGAFVTKSRTESAETYTVRDSADARVLSSTDTVVATTDTTAYTTPKVKFATIYPNSDSSAFSYTCSEFDYTNTDPRCFYDWYSKDGVGTSVYAFILTGYDLGGQGQGAAKRMQVVYITCFFRRTETGIDDTGTPIMRSNCNMRARWDWSDSSASGKWGDTQAVYRQQSEIWLGEEGSATYDDGFPVVVTKNKVRGMGRCLQLHFEGVAGRDCQLLGWQGPFLGATHA